MTPEERMRTIPPGLCGCGCGRRTTVPQYNLRSAGWQRGIPLRFVAGHHRKVFRLRGEKSASWKGGRRMHEGYVLIRMPDHPRATKNGEVFEHIVIVSNAMGRPLPASACVHHVNKVRDDNRNENLVACEDDAYHMLLHQRMRAREACGHADWLRCNACGQYDAPENLYVNKPNIYHAPCHAARMRAYKAQKREERAIA